jgi:competence protein ComEC
MSISTLRWVCLGLLVGCGQLAPAPRVPEGPPNGPNSPPNAPAVAPSPARFALHVADVGTGLAVLVLGADFALIYDGGSNDDLAQGERNRFLAFVKATLPPGRRVDHVILSHPHRDHVELLPDVLRAFPPRQVWEPGIMNPICGYVRFLEAVQETQAAHHTAAFASGTHQVDPGKGVCTAAQGGVRGGAIELRHDTQIQRGLQVPLGSFAQMVFLFASGEPTANMNDASLVVRLDLGDTRVLLPGDAEGGERKDWAAPAAPRSIEGTLLREAPEALRADVLIAGHHGSKTSSRADFLAAVRPRVVVISSGPTRYGSVILPDPEIRERLGTHGPVLDTSVSDDTCGQHGSKIGPDADGKAGGCDNVWIELGPGKRVEARYDRRAD